MKELDLLPENAEFSIQNGDALRWDVAPVKNLSKDMSTDMNLSISTIQKDFISQHISLVDISIIRKLSLTVNG